MFKHISFVMTTFIVSSFISQVGATDPIATDLKDGQKIVTYNLGKSVPSSIDLEGFYGPDGHQNWQAKLIGAAIIDVMQGERRVVSVIFKNTSSFAPQTLDVSLNDQPIGIQCIYEANQGHEIIVPIPLDLNGKAKISFAVKALNSPVDFNIPGDERSMGIALRDVDILLEKSELDDWVIIPKTI